jgi:hypothetical protein
MENRLNCICHIKDGFARNNIHHCYVLKMETAGSSKRLPLLTRLQGASYINIHTHHLENLKPHKQRYTDQRREHKMGGECSTHPMGQRCER